MNTVGSGWCAPLSVCVCVCVCERVCVREQMCHVCLRMWERRVPRGVRRTNARHSLRPNPPAYSGRLCLPRLSDVGETASEARLIYILHFLYFYELPEGV